MINFCAFVCVCLHKIVFTRFNLEHDNFRHSIWLAGSPLIRRPYSFTFAFDWSDKPAMRNATLCCIVEKNAVEKEWSIIYCICGFRLHHIFTQATQLKKKTIFKINLRCKTKIPYSKVLYFRFLVKNVSIAFSNDCIHIYEDTIHSTVIILPEAYASYYNKFCWKWITMKNTMTMLSDESIGKKIPNYFPIRSRKH